MTASLKRLKQLSSRLHSPTRPGNERLRNCKRCERKVARGDGRLRSPWSKDAARRSLSANGHWTLGNSGFDGLASFVTGEVDS